MATLSKGKTFTNGETVTPQKLHELVDLGTISGIVNADIAANAAITDSKLAQITTEGKVLPAAVQGTAVVTADPRLSDARMPVPHGHAISDTTGLEAALNGKQAAGSYAAASHTHDDRYYTETEMNTLLAGKQASGSYAPATGIAQSAVTNLTTDLAGKAASSHTHDDRYYTETEIDTKLSGLPVSGHTHDDRYYTESEIDTKLSGLPVSGHTHDDRYYTETEMNTLLAGKQASGSYAPATGIAQSAVTNLTTDLAGKATSSHTHGNITNAGAIGTTANLPVITGTSGILQAGSFGTAAGSFCQGNDSRLSDARTPVDASVTTAKLALATQMSLVPPGAIMPFAMNTVPTGWLAANGQEVSRFIYDALFTAIGTLYGAGNGSNTFTLPDLRGYFVRGSGTNADGAASGAFGVKQADAVGPHTHGYDDFYQASSLSKTNDNDRTDAASIRMVNVEIVETGITLDRTTKSQAPASTTETRPDNIAMLYCIKF